MTMLNRLGVRGLADYSFPHPAPRELISGRDANDRYIRHTVPYLIVSGGSLEFSAPAGDRGIDAGGAQSM
jgi:hypothetical protein